MSCPAAVVRLKIQIVPNASQTILSLHCRVCRLAVPAVFTELRPTKCCDSTAESHRSWRRPAGDELRELGSELS